jgi:hypothetical protein
MSKGVRIYNGISAAECKGPTMIAPHKVWIPGGLLWPSDIAAHYEWVRAMGARMKARHWRRLVEAKRQKGAAK